MEHILVHVTLEVKQAAVRMCVIFGKSFLISMYFSRQMNSSETFLNWDHRCWLIQPR